MKLSIVFTKRFKKDFKKIESQQKRLTQLKKIIFTLAERIPLEKRFYDHQLKGEYNDCRECHIEPDFLMIYKIEDEMLLLIRCGSHSEFV